MVQAATEGVGTNVIPSLFSLSVGERRPFGISADRYRCVPIIAEKMVPRGGIEPPTRGFSGIVFPSYRSVRMVVETVPYRRFLPLGKILVVWLKDAL